MNRVGATVAAVVMVVVALVLGPVRDWEWFRDEHSEGKGLDLVCATELADACRNLADHSGVDVTIEDAGTTLDTLLAAPNEDAVEFDGWLAPSPFPQIVQEERRRLALPPVLEDPGAPVGRSPLVIAVRADQVDPLNEACADGIDWRCLGDRVRGTSGLRVDYADPTRSAAGLLVLGQATSEYFDDRTDISSTELETDDGYLSWLGRLERQRLSQSFSVFLTTPTFDVYGSTEADVGPVLATASPDRREQIVLLYLEPVATADVVFSAVSGDRGDDLAGLATGGRVREGLAKSGWRVDGQERAPGVENTPALPRTSGLPRPGLLLALRALAAE